MPTNLMPNEAIPQLASQINSPALYWVLQYLAKNGILQNDGDLDHQTGNLLQQLADLGLVDSSTAGLANGQPNLWAINSNGLRVFKFLEKEPTRFGMLPPNFRIQSWIRLESLPDWEQLQVRLMLASLASMPPESWPREKTLPIKDDRPTYLVRITPRWRAAIRILDGEEMELVDLISEETLNFFLQHSRRSDEEVGNRGF